MITRKELGAECKFILPRTPGLTFAGALTPVKRERKTGQARHPRGNGTCSCQGSKGCDGKQRHGVRKASRRMIGVRTDHEHWLMQPSGEIYPRRRI